MQLRGPKISTLILQLMEAQRIYGDLPICSEGNESPDTEIRLTALKPDSTLARKAEDAKKLFLYIY
jgi:hypothetical protein